MLNIKIDNRYVITTPDPFNYVLNEIKISNKGEEYYKVLSYHRTLESLLKHYKERAIKESREVESFKELLDLISELNDNIEKIVESLEK